MKRNDVVIRTPNPGMAFYGRINRIFSDGRIEVLDCGSNIKVYEPHEIKVTDYKGKWDNDYSNLRRKFPVFRRMPSLRKLKKRCAEYDKTVWKKYRKSVKETA